MTPEQLMMPRYEQIGLYPSCENHGYKKIGDVWTDDGKTPVTNQKGDVAVPLHWEQFPELFRKLYWWEKRKPEELPAYVKIGTQVFQAWSYCDYKGGTFYTKGHNNYAPRKSYPLKNSLPSTKEEYETYLSNKHKQKK